MRIASVTLLFVAASCAVDLAAQETFPSVAPRPQQRVRAAGFDIDVFGDLKGFTLTADTKKVADGVEVLALTLRSASAATPPRFSLKWSIPSHDVAGHWMTGRHQHKTIRPDWAGSRLQASMLAREAPVSSLFSSDNRNVLTFAVSDALNTISSGSGVREEDGMIYNEVVFQSRCSPGRADRGAEPAGKLSARARPRGRQADHRVLYGHGRPHHRADAPHRPREREALSQHRPHVRESGGNVSIRRARLPGAEGQERRAAARTVAGADEVPVSGLVSLTRSS